jgi:hypothetical protein
VAERLIALPPARQGSAAMPADEFLTSLDCQNQASQSRLFAQKSPSSNIALQLERLAGFWETLAIEIELSPREASSVADLAFVYLSCAVPMNLGIAARSIP